MDTRAPLIALGLGLVAQALPAQATQQFPPRALILGIPFVSWSEAASLDYANKDVLNPSLPASQAMVLKYWGRDLTSLTRDEQKTPGWTSRGGENGTFDSLRADVSRGIPVVVCLAQTPIAHNPGPAAAIMLATGDSTVREAPGRGESTSGLLGLMVALDTLRRWGEKLGAESLHESLFLACRVVIGYDDARKVVILHDPSFGPAWEVSYSDFDTMWSFWNRLYMANYPDDFARVLARRPAAGGAGGAAYPARTAGQHAAEEYVYGYALAAVDRRDEAAARLKSGLAIPELSSGYRHVLLLEMGRLAEARHDTAGALATYRQAGDVLPQDHRSWVFLGELLQHDARAGSRQQGDSLLRRAAALCADTAAQAAAWRGLPHDFMLMGGCEEQAASPAAAQLAAGEIGFEPPGPGWKRNNEGTGVNLVRVEVPGRRYQALSLWPMDVPEGLRGSPRERQVSEYFAMERQSPRDVPWSGFVEGTRDIAHRRYPTLSAQIHVASDESHPPVLGDALFVLVFPDDFATRQRFYVVMWMDYHLASEHGAGPKALDTFVSGLKIH
jgi:tetratricopeptide (TPR) repeat protein